MPSFQIIFHKEQTFAYIIPLVLMFVFMSFSTSLENISWISSIVEGNIMNILVYFSLGLLIIGNYIQEKFDTLKEEHELLISTNNVLEVLVVVKRALAERMKYLSENKSEDFERDSEEIEFLMEVNDYLHEFYKLQRLKGI